MASGASIISNISSNLTNTYSYLASLYPQDGVTYKNITAARNDTSNYLTLNQPFAAYLQNNFSTLDKDGDGVISAKEMSNLTNTISQSGVSRSELTQLAASGAYSTDLVNKILENEENYKKATQTSVFYSDDSSSDVSSYSILSYRYKNYNNSSSK